ncbi:MAG: hypothetical protein BGN92_13545 [Sphingobacteriales bacterium 41-5]|nr:MAG: hypothetical protein BGN92_13545 [Sphingobacteriales bacterium 41-5]
MLDIRLFEDEDAGIRIAHFLQEHYSIPFIFLSGYSDETTLKHAKLYKPATFITKPIIEKQLLVAVEMAFPEKNKLKTKTIFLKGKYFENVSLETLRKLSFQDHDFISKEIRFEDVTIIQSFNHIKRNTVLIKFRWPNSFLVVGSTIEKTKAMLPDFFEQVHQSFIVNTRYITAQRKGHYVTIGGESVPVGAAFKKLM